MAQKNILTTEEKFTNLLMKRGKKSIAEKIIAETFEYITKKAVGKQPKEVFEKAIKNASPLLEIRARRIGGSNYQIPHEVSPERRTTLAMRWIIEAASKRKGAHMPARLGEELMAAAEGQGASIKKKEDTHKMAEANKAFAHFARFA